MSSTSLKVTSRSRRGDGSPSAARSANSSFRSLSASALSTRSTFLREPSGKRNKAIQRCFPSFHLTVARWATLTTSLCSDVANYPKGYAESGYVGWDGESPGQRLALTRAYPVEATGIEPATSCMPSAPGPSALVRTRALTTGTFVLTTTAANRLGPCPWLPVWLPRITNWIVHTLEPAYDPENKSANNCIRQKEGESQGTR